LFGRSELCGKNIKNQKKLERKIFKNIKNQKNIGK
jgi:hypothetical protein